MTETDHVDPFTAIGAGQRQQAYRRLARNAPIHRIMLPTGPSAWLVTEHAQVRRVLNEPRLVKAPSPSGTLAGRLVPELAPALTSHMLQRDPPEHTRLRRLVGATFTHRRVERLAPRIQQIADLLLDNLEGATEIDLIASYALPLPMTVICELLGVPPGHARTDLRDWTEMITAATFVTEEAFVAAATAFVALIRELVTEKRRHPAEDLLSALVAVREGGDRLSEDELTSMVFLLVVAGHETTVNLIGNGVYALLTHPDQLTRLRATPDLITTAIEELLRFDGSLQVGFPLRATEPLQIGDRTIEAGEIVVPGLLAANRDPACAADPDSLDVGRKANSHVAFGHGVHHCLGAPLARLEGRIALTTLLNRFPRLGLAVPTEELTWRPNFLFHGLTALPVTLR